MEKISKIKSSISIGKMLLTGFVGTAVLVSSLFYLKKKEEIKPEIKLTIALNNNENPIKEFNINSDKDTILIYESGTIIKIPKESFVDENGKVIKGNVDFDYREFHNISETILGNIPMRYDSAGVKSDFESAGMFEVFATKDNKPVYVNQNKSIEVQLATLDGDKIKFNQYYMKDRKSGWVYINKDTVNTIKVADVTPKEKIIAYPNKRKLIKPEKANSDKHQFTIEVAEGIFPELAVFKNVIFEESEKNKDYNAEKANKSWYGALIERIGETKDYKITFTNPNETYQVIAYPVCDTTDYKEAIAKYNKLNEVYSKKLNEKTNSEKIKEDKLNSQFFSYVESMNRYRELLKKNQKVYNDSMAVVFQEQKLTEASQEIVYRTFQVKEFGIWNSDCPKNLPQGVILAANYQNENGEIIKPAALYLIEKGKNAMYTLSLSQKLSFNPDAETVLIIITADNTLAWVPSASFSGMDKSLTSHTFKVQTLKKQSYSLADINNIII